MNNPYDVRADRPVDITTARQLGWRSTTGVLVTYKLITMASVTLRLYDPSTLFETQALHKKVHS